MAAWSAQLKSGQAPLAMAAADRVFRKSRRDAIAYLKQRRSMLIVEIFPVKSILRHLK
jgi:hypothetical protein